MGAREKGARDPFPQAASREDHLNRALSEPFRMAVEVPLPGDVSAAIEFLKRTQDGPLKEFWDPQILALKELAQNPLCSSTEWYS